jgi:hypothetical protein
MRLAWSDQKQKFTKVPIDLKTGSPANRDEMRVAFAVAKHHLQDDTVLSYRHPYGSAFYLALIDVDRCTAPDGSVSRWVQNLLRYMNVYAEYSVSGNIHILCWIDAVPPDGHKDRERCIEYYWMPRSIPITGNRVVLPDWESPYDLQECTQRFLKLHKSRFAQAWMPSAQQRTLERSSVLSREEVLEKLFRERAGKKWADVYAGNWQGHYESPSDADLALLMKFAFYSGKDRQMMASMFSACAASKVLVRGTVEHPILWRTPKWLNDNYRKTTLDSAIAKTTSVYTPREKPLSAQELYKKLRGANS